MWYEGFIIGSLNFETRELSFLAAVETFDIPRFPPIPTVFYRILTVLR